LRGEAGSGRNSEREEEEETQGEDGNGGWVGGGSGAGSYIERGEAGGNLRAGPQDLFRGAAPGVGGLACWGYTAWGAASRLPIPHGVAAS
jgi:hypothetical protein